MARSIVWSAVLSGCVGVCGLTACGDKSSASSSEGGNSGLPRAGASSSDAGTSAAANAAGTSAGGSANVGGDGANTGGDGATVGGAPASAGSSGADTGGVGTAGGGTAGAGAGAGGAGTAGAGAAGAGQVGAGTFPSSAPFYQDISNAKVDAQSGTILDALNAIGWGDAPNRTALGIDFSFNINQADPAVARRAFTKSASFYSPDCDTAPVPLPPAGKGEGVQNYACTGGDCHLFVYQGPRLYELYQSNITGGMAVGGTFKATCLVVWDLTKDYWVPQNPPNFSRGDGCTGADAAGLPMAPLVLTQQDVASGVKHALRFTIDNNRIAATVYVHPATHLGGPTGGADTLPYGARLRLRGNFNLASLPSDAARTVAKGLQTYGMYLADGGNIYISATADASASINNAILGALTPNDFELVDGGTRIDAASQDCKHVPITQ
ncbi:MAG TPA: hypothetical protein VIK01_15830 [Polyangiaceae bacterium]